MYKHAPAEAPKTVAYKEKVNLKELVMLALGLAILWGIIPPEYADRLTQTILIGSPAIGLVLRSFFSSDRLVWSDTPGLTATNEVTATPGGFDPSLFEEDDTNDPVIQ